MNSYPSAPINPGLEAMHEWKLRRAQTLVEDERLLVERCAGDALERLEALDPERRRRVIVITRNPCVEYALDLLDLQPGALLIGSPTSTDIAAALVRVARHSSPKMPELTSPLLPSERAILRFLPSGTCNKRIGRALGLSHRTVRNRLVSIAEKLGLDNRTQIAMYYSGQWQWLESYRARDPLLTSGATIKTRSRRDSAN
jgi:DNA-binding NarL/FixJ family response regulator